MKKKNGLFINGTTRLYGLLADPVDHLRAPGALNDLCERRGVDAVCVPWHAITGLTRSTSLDGRKYDIACGQIDIGNAETAMAEVFKTGVPQANGTIAPEPTMDLDNVARAVVYMASLPLDANVQFMTVMATKMPFIGRG